MAKFIPDYSLYGDQAQPRWQTPFFFEWVPQRAQPYNFTIRPHIHGALIQLMYLTHGSVTAVVDQMKVSLDAPCVLVIPAQTVHGWNFTPDVDGPIVTAAQSPLETLAEVLMPALLQTLRTPKVLQLLHMGEGREELLQAFLSIEREARGRATGHVAAGMSLIIALIVQIARLQETLAAAPLRGASRKSEQVAKFRKLVEEHFKEHWSVQAYAENLGVTPGQLTRLCRDLLGMSSSEVVHARLCNEAQRDLVYTTNSIGQLANRLGFADEAYFSRFFRKQSGYTPREFRRLAMEGVPLVVSCSG
ncbi:helix-turn-helix domain-containing protein [Rhodoferax sp. WC2427]|uniref:helix-turn-helix domain-containing protein n=1 Tax=Rhodoferax sp. WC2427 TaxID=3234144 RepID=UPI0034668A6F